MTVDKPIADIRTRVEGLTAEQGLADAATRYPGRIAFYTTLGVELCAARVARMTQPIRTSPSTHSPEEIR